MAETKLGRLQDEHAGRDAVHVAVIPLITSTPLRPGQRVVMVGGSHVRGCVDAKEESDYVGVVDPFISPALIAENERVLVFARPGTITGLRHVWTHPIFDAETPEHGAAEMRLRQFAESLGFTYAHMLELCREYQSGRGEWAEPAVIEWRFEGMYIPEGFWDDYKLVTGAAVRHDGAFFSCGGCSS